MNLFSFITQVAIVFACTRAVQDISYSYLPLFLTDTLDFQKVCADFTQLSWHRQTTLCVRGLIYVYMKRRESMRVMHE